jgi:hypothetical protein
VTEEETRLARCLPAKREMILRKVRQKLRHITKERLSPPARQSQK